MNRIRKLLAKDKYAIGRGTLLLVILLLLCAVLVVEMLAGFGRASVEERASDTASRVVGQFEQMVRGAFIDLYGAAVLISEDPSRTDMFLGGLSEFSPYNETGIMSENVIHHRDGTTNTISYETAYVYTVDGVPRGRIIALQDGSILLCATIEPGREIVARYDPEALDRILGSSFKEDYDFAVYNATTGVYLVNHTSFTGGGYYDALLSLNEGGSTAGLLSGKTAIAHIDEYGGVYIAQERSAIRPWNVALVIPDAAVSMYLWSRSWVLAAILGAVLLLLSVHALFIGLVGRRMRADQAENKRTLEDYARMLNDMALEAQVTLFIYHRGEGSLMHCYDGLELLGQSGGGRRLTSLAALEAACGLSEGDVDRLHERINELTHGESAELMLNGALPDREERKLSFKLNAHAEDGDVIVCSVRDCTQELAFRSRAEIEQNFLESNMQRTVAVWAINVSRNLWHNLYMRDPAELGPLAPLEKADWRDFTADLGSLLRKYIYPVDYADHAQQMSIAAIAESYRSGRTEFDMDYRVCSENMEDYQWHRLHVRVFPDPDTGDIMANIFVFNVDTEKNAELERGERKRIFKKTMRALSGLFYSLYYVDLDNDICYAAKSYDGEVMTKLSAPYRETFDRYLEGVHPEDREALRAMLDAFSIRRAINEGARSQRMEYRRHSGDDYRWAVIVIQPARFENGRIKDVVIAMRHLDSKRDGSV